MIHVLPLPGLQMNITNAEGVPVLVIERPFDSLLVTPEPRTLVRDLDDRLAVGLPYEAAHRVGFRVWHGGRRFKCTILCHGCCVINPQEMIVRTGAGMPIGRSAPPPRAAPPAVRATAGGGWTKQDSPRHPMPGPGAGG